MNSSGWLRSLMATTMREEEFLLRVADIIGREFEQQVLVLEIARENYLIVFMEYSIILSRERIRDLKDPIGPYRLDRYILESFMIQGFSFDNKRSQYIRYVLEYFRNKWKKRRTFGCMCRIYYLIMYYKQ